MSFAKKVIRFYKELKAPVLPAGTGILHPQTDPQVMGVIKAFYTRYFADSGPRVFLFGINPGRHGGGITGIPFTGPRQLTAHCGINHSFGHTSELSAEFIYEMIAARGGCEAFYSRFYITAVSPLGFVKAGKNLNYYDDRALQDSLAPFISEAITRQLAFGAERRHCICIGGDKNYRYLSNWNEAALYFEHIHPLPHPRFILQYRRKQKAEYIRQYLDTLDVCLKK